MKTFREFVTDTDPSYIMIVGLDDLGRSAILGQCLLQEGRWVPSAKSGWLARVDAPNPGTRTHRHVHVAQAKHLNASNMQAAWNEEGTRHDKGRFNAAVGNSSTAQTVARDALGLGSNVVLEDFSEPEQLLVESADLLIVRAPVPPIFLRARVAEEAR
jgi:hypothetical protein